MGVDGRCEESVDGIIARGVLVCLIRERIEAASREGACHSLS